ncbi:MAG: S-methyl-5-thioribose-1-phosphate isomerase [Planctomycetes bacterium]|nr:S-methyl-5-thioribose-1-phosphate isomerase [Planctomycetota bacterium]
MESLNILSPTTLEWVGGLPGHVRMIEQTRLPEHHTLEVRTVSQMVDAIRRLAVRGAPAIGIAAGMGVLLGVQSLGDQGAKAVHRAALEACQALSASRPTAVNLFWALGRMEAAAHRGLAAGLDGEGLVQALQQEALAIWNSDRSTCERMGRHGSTLIHDGMGLLTHCNAGALATSGMGTALAPMYVAHAQGKRFRVFADETRPLLQGSRISAWELQQAGIDVTVITDSMAAKVMQEGRIQAVFVGSDRIAGNGDVCNKIGTYGVALAAHYHQIPFYVVAPLSTFDPSLESGDQIPIEERDRSEVAAGLGRTTVPEGVAVYNPAFDVTPAKWVRAIITEVGIMERPDAAKVRAALAAESVR